MLRLSNPRKLQADFERAVRSKLQSKVVPIFKGIVLEAANALVKGTDGYAGTPQWTGNAAANWYVMPAGSVAPYTEFFTDPAPPGDPKYAGPSEFSGRNSQREAAVKISIDRIKAALLTTTNLKLDIVNSAPQLTGYEPYATGPNFRAENLWPITPSVLAPKLIRKIKNASEQDLQNWRTML